LRKKRENKNLIGAQRLELIPPFHWGLESPSDMIDPFLLEQTIAKYMSGGTSHTYTLKNIAS
jgi:hypothetical protein